MLKFTILAALLAGICSGIDVAKIQDAIKQDIDKQKMQDEKLAELIKSHEALEKSLADLVAKDKADEEGVKDIWEIDGAIPGHDDQDKWLEADIKLDPQSKALLKAMKSGHDIANDVATFGKWPGSPPVIPYIMTGLTTSKQNAIKAAIADYHAKTCLRFVPRTNQAKYLEFFSGGGCWSYIGRTSTPKQQISIGTNCGVKYIVIHEMMHAIGFWHEQSRRDRDNHVTVNKANIRKGMEHNFNIFAVGRGQYYNFPYDKQSVMHYSRTAFSTNGQPTIVSNSNYNEVLGNNKGFTQTDINQINAHYCGGKPGPGPVTQPPVTIAPPVTTAAPTGDDKYMFCKVLNVYCTVPWVKANCPKTCDANCQDKHDKVQCGLYAKYYGFCSTSSKFHPFMAKNCKKSCKFC